MQTIEQNARAVGSSVYWGDCGDWLIVLAVHRDSGALDRSNFEVSVMCVFFLGVPAVKFAFVAEVFPTRLRATGLAFCGSLAVTLGSAAGPKLIGWAIDRHGWDVALSAYGAVPLFAAGLFYLFLRPIPSGLDVDAVQAELGK